MWTLIKLAIGFRLALLIAAFLAVFGGFLILGVGNMISQADQQRLIRHNIEDSHRLHDWRLK